MPMPPPVKLPLRRRPRLGERRGEREAMRGMMCGIYLRAICSVGRYRYVLCFFCLLKLEKDEAISNEKRRGTMDAFPDGSFGTTEKGGAVSVSAAE